MNRQNILTIILIIVLGLSGYFWYVYSQSQPVVTPEGAGGAAAGDTQINYAKVKNISPDLTLFSDPFFTALVPLPYPLKATTTPGRPNPFVPF